MIRTSRQLKALVRNRSNGNSARAQMMIRIYAMERFLERLAISDYRENFVLKGGLLVSSLVGLARRSTMDIDATIRNLPLTPADAKRVVQAIIDIPLDDGIRFEIQQVSEIMEEAEYSGVRMHLVALMESMRTPIAIDISTGDVVTPGDIRYSYKLMFEQREIELCTYNLSTILAEKIETIISRGTANSRLRDYYDLYILSEQYTDSINFDEVGNALEATSRKRGSQAVLKDWELIIEEIQKDEGLKQLWHNYQNKFEYAVNLEWEKVIETLKSLMQKVL